MWPLGYNPSFFHDDDPVRGEHRGKPVRNNDAGAVAHQVFQSELHNALGFRVQGAGGLVQHQQGRIFKQVPGQWSNVVFARPRA